MAVFDKAFLTKPVLYRGEKIELSKTVFDKLDFDVKNEFVFDTTRNDCQKQKTIVKSRIMVKVRARFKVIPHVQVQDQGQG